VKKVDTKVIFPNNFIGNPQIVELHQILSNNNNDIPKLKSNCFQNKKIGIIFISGNIKELDFSNSQVDLRANKCDALALWFGNDLNFPGANYDDSNHLLLSDTYIHMSDYFALPEMIKILIMGVEQTLLRRVTAIGQRDKWMLVPKIRTREIEK